MLIESTANSPTGSEPTPHVLLTLHPSDSRTKFSVQPLSIPLEESQYLAHGSGCGNLGDLLRTLESAADGVPCKVFRVQVLLDQPVLLEVPLSARIASCAVQR